MTTTKYNPAVVVPGKDELRRRVLAARRRGDSIGFVPTMGALHAGHLSLVETCRRECDFTVVSIFVNPTQFGPNEDFARYPRNLQADLEALSGYDVDLVFVPEVDEVYPPGASTSIHVDGVASLLEGAARPGHFTGVATVVLKLLNMVSPDIVYFGHKDYQQTLVVRRMVRDLDVPVEVRICPTVRESDGLALSSRNAYLSVEQRAQALAISQSLNRAEALVAAGERNCDVILTAMRDILDAQALLDVQYAVLVDPQTLAAVEQIWGPTLAAIAAFVGQTRLIDNRMLAAD